MSARGPGAAYGTSIPIAQSPLVPLHVLLRTDRDPRALAEPHLLASLSGLFSIVAALLAALGLYGVVTTSD